MSQASLARLLGVKNNNFHYVLQSLAARRLIVCKAVVTRQVTSKPATTKGLLGEVASANVCRTNMVHLTRFAPQQHSATVAAPAAAESVGGRGSAWPLAFLMGNIQQWGEREAGRERQGKSEVPGMEGDGFMEGGCQWSAEPMGGSGGGGLREEGKDAEEGEEEEQGKEEQREGSEVVVGGYESDAAAIEVICRHLQEARGQVLVRAELKASLGYRFAHGHRTWRRVCGGMTCNEIWQCPCCQRWNACVLASSRHMSRTE